MLLNPHLNNKLSKKLGIPAADDDKDDDIFKITTLL